MGYISLIIGAVAGAGATYFYFNKQKEETTKQTVHKQVDPNTNYDSLKQEIKGLEDEIEKYKIQNKKLKTEIDNLDDKNDDYDTEVTKLKRSNNSMFQEIEKLKAEILEYEMVYNARKQEIEELKNKLNAK